MTRTAKTACPESAAQDWHRSYPAESVTGTRWMLDALDDLTAFARFRSLDDVADEIALARARVAGMMGEPAA